MLLIAVFYVSILFVTSKWKKKKIKKEKERENATRQLQHTTTLTHRATPIN